MNGYYWRWSRRFVGFGRMSDTLSLWPRFRLGFVTLEIFPGEIADRVEKLLAVIQRERAK